MIILPNDYDVYLACLDCSFSFRSFLFFGDCSCRVKESLPELPLSAHLLAPIQRICRYPLHLMELVKHSPAKQDLLRTSENDSDQVDGGHCETADTKESFDLALTTMKRVTEMVNEGNYRRLFSSVLRTIFGEE